MIALFTSCFRPMIKLWLNLSFWIIYVKVSLRVLVESNWGVWQIRLLTWFTLRYNIIYGSCVLSPFVKMSTWGIPLVAQWLTSPTRNDEVAGSIPGLAQWLRIQRCHELWCRSQMRLNSHVVVAVAWAGICSSDSTPTLGTSTCHGYGSKKKKRELLFMYI